MAPLTDISRAFGQQSAEPISRTMQYRKITKPLLERQRRARINRCLDELKDILVSGLQNEGENVARLEKADILELTVRHLQKLTYEQTKAATSPVGDDEKFRAGFATCAQEISRVLANTPKMDVQLGTTLMMHLGHALNQISTTPQTRPTCIRATPSPASSSRPSSACSADYRPYTPPASPQSAEVSSSSLSPKSMKIVWRPW
ncbi:unnamed protein product [Allacma fusca]|uniref:Enhancer of split mgamma protein n=1 Tax=Allacma fusca TaxID=39272 RepID=A0A8J2L3I9_9HEXA|nr:unnamed protein product [Allacma fusca]